MVKNRHPNVRRAPGENFRKPPHPSHPTPTIANVYGPPRGWEGGQNYPPTPSPTPGTKNPGMGVPGR